MTSDHHKQSFAKPSQSGRGGGGRYAERAEDAWAQPANGGAVLRASLRGATLSAITPFWRASPNFIRCLYGHAVFPEHRDVFRSFLRQLKGMGDVIDTPTLIALMQSTSAPEGRYFHLSFDDGFANVYEVGAEALLAEKVPATLFVATDLIEADFPLLSDYFRQLGAYARPVRTMTWAQVRAASESGIEIGSHTRSHARLSQVSSDAERLRDEVSMSKQIIEERTGRECRSFAWPYGTAADIDAVALGAIRSAGYSVCFSAVRGRVDPCATDLFRVPRHQVEFHQPLSHALLWARGFREAKR